MSTRVKGTAIRAPQNLKEAQTMLACIGQIDRELAAVEADCEKQMAAIRGLTADYAESLNKHIEMRFRALQAFVEVNRDELIPKKRESVAWPAGVVGFRKTPLAVSIAKAKFDDIVRALRKRKLSHCLRKTVEIDKDALKRHRKKVEDIEGIKFRTRTEFYIKTLDAGVEHVAKVKAPKVTKTSGKAKPATLRLDWRIVMLAIALALLVAVSRPAPAQEATGCDQRSDVIARLAKKYGEAPVALGVTNKGGLVEVLATDDGKTWTIIVSMPDGTACMVAAGEGWRPVLAPEEIEGPEA